MLKMNIIKIYFENLPIEKFAQLSIFISCIKNFLLRSSFHLFSVVSLNFQKI